MNNKQHDIIVMWDLFGFYHEKNMNICIGRTKVTKREMIIFVNYVTYVDKVNLLRNDITNVFISMYELHQT